MMKKIKVLIVENAESDEELLLLKLTRAGYTVESERVESAVQMRKSLAEKEWDVIISDYEMPSFTGMEAHSILQESGHDIPFIIVSGSIGEEIAVQAMLAGVNDYLMKDNLARLIPAIERELRSAKDRENQRKSEKELFENSKRYRNLFDGANDAIYTIDLEGNFTSINKKCDQLLGLSRKEVLKVNFNDFISEQDAEKIRKLREQKIKGQLEETVFEFKLTTKDGEEKDVEVNSRIIYKDGKPFEIQGIARDITTRKKLENDLIENTKRLNLALDAAEMGVWEWNIQTNDVFWSPECYKTLKQKTFGGKLENFISIVYPEDLDRILASMNRVIEEKGTSNIEYRTIADDGEIIWICDEGIVEYDENEKPLRCIGTFKDITVHKKLQQNLIATEARFRTLAENNVAGVTLCQADGNLIFVNDAYLGIVGYSREDFESGKLKWNELTAPEFHEADRKGIEQARQNGKSEQYEKEYIRKDDSRVSVLVVIAFSKIDGDENFISTILDFTERKKAEKELSESGEDFRALVKATSQSVWTIAGGEESDQFNEFWQNLTGQSVEDTRDMGWLDVVHPEDREFVRQEWYECFTNNTSLNTVYRVLTVSGKYNYFAVRGIPVFDEKGAFRKWIGTFNDITERKEVEEELRRSEARLQLSQQSAKIGTWEWNLATNETIWSDGVWSQFGLELKSIDTNYANYMDFVLPEDIKSLENALENSLKSGDALDAEYRVRRTDGNISWICAKGSVVYDKNGNPERMIGVTIDITERKTAEENLQKTEENLRQAQRLESIGRLAGGIAHDFNNMLTAINGYSDLTLRRMDKNDPLHGFIEEIKKAGERSAVLTHQLLAFSRRQILQTVVLDVNRIISETTVMLQRLIGEDVRLIENFNPEIGQIEADPGQITQVIMNLAVNSRDAMPKGGILSITTENTYLDDRYAQENSEVKEGHYILIKVSDTGIGIDNESLENIFEPFFTTKNVGSGTGLGLATVYGIVKQSGGHINVHSTVDEGTTFEIYLPRIEEKLQPNEQSDSTQNLPVGTETILIVEDEEIVRRLTCEILKSHGYKIIEAENGEDALVIFEQLDCNFDLLLTDVVMPKMGGHELAEKIAHRCSQMRILFTSGYTEDSQIKYEMKDVVSDFIHKPFSPELLAQKVRKMLDKKLPM